MGSLLHAAVVAVGIFEPQTHFGSVFLEVKKLFGVEGSTSLPTKSRGQKRFSNSVKTLYEPHNLFWSLFVYLLIVLIPVP